MNLQMCHTRIPGARPTNFKHYYYFKHPCRILNRRKIDFYARAPTAPPQSNKPVRYWEFHYLINYSMIQGINIDIDSSIVEKKV